MFRFEFQTPRFAFAVTAMAMTAITLGVLVVVPSRMQSDGQTPVMLAASSVRFAALRATVLWQLHALRSPLSGTQKNVRAEGHS